VNQRQVRQLFPQWMRIFLRSCFAYNFFWAIVLLAFTPAFVKWITGSEYVNAYQVELHGVGLFILSGIFLLTSYYPIRFWYLIAFGFLTKTFGWIWVYFSIMQQNVTTQFLIHLFVNDFIWAAALSFIAYKAFRLYMLMD